MSTTLEVSRTQNLILEDLQYTGHIKLDEEYKKQGKYVVRGIFAICDIVTGNSRIYPSQVMKKAIDEILPSVKERKIFGHLDHPADAKTQLSLASHIITDLQFTEQDGRNVVLGEAIILDNQHGKQLLSIVQAGGKVGISSRGIGSVVKNDEGIDVVQDDFKLFSFDFVADPANFEAYPQVFIESKENKIGGVNMEGLTLDELREKFPKAYKQLREEFDKKIEEWKRVWKEAIEKRLRNDILYLIDKERNDIENKVREEQKLTAEFLGSDRILQQIVKLLKSYIGANGVVDISNEVKEEQDKLKELLKEKEEELQEYENFIKDLGRRYMYAEYIKGPNEFKLKEILDKVPFEDFKQFRSAIEEAKKKLAAEDSHDKEKEGEKVKKEIPVTSKDEDIEDVKKRIADRIKKLKTSHHEDYEKGHEKPQVADEDEEKSNEKGHEKEKSHHEPHHVAGEEEEKSYEEAYEDLDARDDIPEELKRRIRERKKMISSSESKDIKLESKDDLKSVELYMIKKTENHPMRYKIRQMFKEGKIRSKKDVDLLCEAFKLNKTNVMVESLGVSNVQEKSLDESSFEQLLGISIDEYKKLSGMN